MHHLKSVNKYFWKYRSRLLLGMLFIVLSNYFRILAPQISGYVVDKVVHSISEKTGNQNIQAKKSNTNYDVLVKKFVKTIESSQTNFGQNVIICGITLLLLAIMSGVFMFFMRQTIIVMSRLIEFDQKNEVFRHYQQLDTAFYKTHSTGDLMNRISEDISRVRMYTGPAIMYMIKLAATIGFSLYYMFKENVEL